MRKYRNLRKRTKRNKRRRYKRTSPYTRVNNVYPVRLPSPIVSWCTPTYDSQNLNFDLSEYLITNARFIELSSKYQYFKLRSVVVKFTPDCVQGTLPRISYGIFLGANDLVPIYADIPELPGAFKVSNKKATVKRYTRPGRNPDFNIWYDCQKAADISFSLRLRAVRELGTVPMYIQAIYYLAFSKRINATLSKQEQQNFTFGIDLVNLARLKELSGDQVDKRMAAIKQNEDFYKTKAALGREEDKELIQESQLGSKDDELVSDNEEEREVTLTNYELQL